MRFSAPVQSGPGAHPASHTMGTVPFPGIKGPGRGFNNPPFDNLSHRLVELTQSPFGTLAHSPFGTSESPFGTSESGFGTADSVTVLVI